MLDPRSTPTPELARALAQLLHEGAPWTSACRQLGVVPSRATHWRREQPWFGTLVRLAVFAAYTETIERLNPGALSATRHAWALDAAARVREALHAPLPIALRQLLEDPPFTVGPEHDELIRTGLWRMEQRERLRRERISDGVRRPDDPDRGERLYQALAVLFGEKEGDGDAARATLEVEA